MHERMERKTGPNAYRLSIPGRFHSIFDTINQRLLGELLNTTDPSAVGVEHLLFDATWCYQTAVADLPIRIVDQAIVRPLGELFAKFQEMLVMDPSCNRASTCTLRHWITEASEMLLRFIELLGNVRDRRVHLDHCSSPRLGTLSSDLVVAGRSSGDHVFGCLQSLLVLLDAPCLADLRPRASSLLADDVVRLCDTIRKAHRALLTFTKRPVSEHDSGSPALSTLPSTASSVISAVRHRSKKRRQGSQDLVTVQSAFDTLLPFFNLYDDDAMLASVASIMSIAKMLDTEITVLGDAAVMTTTIMDGTGTHSYGGKDVAYRGPVFCQQVFPRLLALLKRRPLDEVRSRFAIILGVCSGLSYRDHYLMSIANELLAVAGGNTFAPFVNSFARILFNLYKPMCKPYVGWVDHPLCSQRFITSMTGLPGSNI
eukprot:ANDGO_00745.mRNA.1 hypothetical protein